MAKHTPVIVKTFTSFLFATAVSLNAFADKQADESVGKEVTSGPYIVMPNGGQIDLKRFLQFRRDLIPYITLGIRGSGENDDTNDDDVEICDLGACECLCSDEFNDLMTGCLIASDPEACCEIDEDYC